MAPVPTATPDGQKIRQLIWERGYSIADFARLINQRPAAQTLYNVVSKNQRISVAYVRNIARGLGVQPSDISDWTGDDDIEPAALAS